MTIESDKFLLKSKIEKTDLQTKGLKIEDQDLYTIGKRNQAKNDFVEMICQIAFMIIIISGVWLIGVYYGVQL